MSLNKLLTYFASPERADADTIRVQAESFAAIPFLQRMVDFLPNVFLVLNKERQVVFANGALLDALGLKSKDLALGRRPGEILSCVHSTETEAGCGTSEACAFCGAVRAILNCQEGRNVVEECRIITPDNSAYDLRVWASPYEHNGETFTVFAVKDISDEKRRRALERVFFHDIMNTAGGIQNLSMLIREASESEIDEYVKMIRDSAETLIEEINAQRQLLAAENAELALNISDVNSLRLLSQVSAVYSKHNVANGKTLAASPDTEDFTFRSDAALLKRLLGNLVKNALESSRPGQAVTMGAARDAKLFRFWVHNPNAIPKDVQMQIFQRSFSTKGPGRGLGTYSVKLLAEKYLRGRASFTSSPEAGTTFTVVLPSL